jgi:hypothetical protein
MFGIILLRKLHKILLFSTSAGIPDEKNETREAIACLY